MKFRMLFAALVVALLVAPSVGRAQVSPPDPSFEQKFPVVIHNASDAWGWFTVYTMQMGYKRAILDAFCVNPHTSFTRTFHGEGRFPDKPYDVMVEALHKGCSHPLMAKHALGWDGKAPYYLKGSNGAYTFAHTP